jgi:hypothetical protein
VPSIFIRFTGLVTSIKKLAPRPEITYIIYERQGINMDMDSNARNVFLSNEYAEANRYMDNAADALKKAGTRDNGLYKDKKYVETACGVAYIGVLHALDAWLKVNDVPEPRKKDKTIYFYKTNVGERDEVLASWLNVAYNTLHINGYYRGTMSVKVLEGGFDAAREIIEKIKPEQFVPVRETRAQGVKRALNNLLISVSVFFRGF